MSMMSDIRIGVLAGLAGLSSVSCQEETEPVREAYHSATISGYEFTGRLKGLTYTLEGSGLSPAKFECWMYWSPDELRTNLEELNTKKREIDQSFEAFSNDINRLIEEKEREASAKSSDSK